MLLCLYYPLGREVDILINHHHLPLANLSGKLLAEGGLLTLIGAAAAVGPTPGMIGYGMAKSATHHLVSSLAVDDGLCAGFSGTLVRCDVAALLPTTIDTLGNRA